MRMQHKFENTDVVIRLEVDGEEIVWDTANRAIGQSDHQDLAIPRSLLKLPTSGELNMLIISKVEGGFFNYLMGVCSPSFPRLFEYAPFRFLHPHGVLMCIDTSWAY